MSDERRAYVPGYAHDLFVSYASVDDLCDTTRKDELGWVSCLISQLTVRVDQLLGRRNSVAIFQDVQLAKNVEITGQLMTAVEKTAVLLVVVSPAYMESDWCRRERETFLKWVNYRLESGSRVFLVERERVGGRPEEFGKPSEFTNLLGYKFWIEDNRRSRPLDKYRDSDEELYDSKLNELAWDIASELKRLKRRVLGKTPGVVTPNQEPAPVRPFVPALASTPAATRMKVFLAETTDDIRPLRKKVQRHLDQFGITCIAPDSALLRNPDQDLLEQSFDPLLSDTDLFVQLLSKVPGPPVCGSCESLVSFQHRRAVALGKNILQWRDPSVTEESWDVEAADYDDVDVEPHREIVFGKTVRAVNLEDFKTDIVALATRPPSPPQETDSGMIFVNFNRATKDAEFAKELCGYLDQKGFGVIKPVDLADGDPETIRQDFELNVRDCNALIVVYGDQSAKLWTRRQLGEIYKLFCEHRKPLYALALCAVPPPDKDPQDPVGYKPPRMTVIDCQDGCDFEKLGPFLDALSRSAAEHRHAPSPAVLV